MPVCSLSVLEWSSGVTRVTPFSTAAALSISCRVTSWSSILTHQGRGSHVVAPSEGVAEVPTLVTVARLEQLRHLPQLASVRRPSLHFQLRLVGQSADEGANKRIYVQACVGGLHVAAPGVPPLERIGGGGRQRLDPAKVSPHQEGPVAEEALPGDIRGHPRYLALLRDYPVGRVEPCPHAARRERGDHRPRGSPEYRVGARLVP